MVRIGKAVSVVNTTGLLMPGDFPVAAYQAVHMKLVPYAEKNNLVYAQFAGAWNAISYRFNALDEYDELFSSSIAKYGAGPPADERYRQERDLFGFFSNGFSTFEALFYGAFSAAALVRPAAFPIATAQDQRRITASQTAAAYATAFPGDPILAALKTVITDPAYVELRDVRNVLSHRSAPGRTIHVAIGEEPAPDQWKLENIILDEKTTATRRSRIAKVLTEATEAFQKFASAVL
jgi:hypothetical protein